MTLQGGVSTGRRVTDNCDVIDDCPKPALLTAPYCHQKENFLTDGKLVWTYTIPKIDVTVSGLFFSRPGPPDLRQPRVPNAESSAVARPQSVDQRAERDGQPGAPGHAVRRSPQPARPALHQAVHGRSACGSA